ncbi:hypothetical protein RFI_06973 [Reticulomyxa filosa]|uniref:SAM domain-containing protein n=1 Tax=Reticulomyxa filosa TaxID=46433 RepID=X6NW88_RETFI|nr:hypothetical protein RFI_06973 [Reticulomyxa filosa]|eukprot:ETO30148.1 hypothetical protein RFI_06973 [Reticulomyxa filosa]
MNKLSKRRKNIKLLSIDITPLKQTKERAYLHENWTKENILSISAPCGRDCVLHEDSDKNSTSSTFSDVNNIMALDLPNLDSAPLLPFLSDEKLIKTESCHLFSPLLWSPNITSEKMETIPKQCIQPPTSTCINNFIVFYFLKKVILEKKCELHEAEKNIISGDDIHLQQKADKLHISDHKLCSSESGPKNKLIKNIINSFQLSIQTTEHSHCFDHANGTLDQVNLPTLENISATPGTPSSFNENDSSMLTNSPHWIEEEWNKIINEEKSQNQSYEEMLQVVQAQISEKLELFLKSWKGWGMEDFHLYLTRIDDKQFAKYFISVDEMKLRWSKDHIQPFQGTDLTLFDREDLQTLGVTNKDDRIILAERIRDLCQGNLQSMQI